jgi:hypothetical protein
MLMRLLHGNFEEDNLIGRVEAFREIFFNYDQMYLTSTSSGTPFKAITGSHWQGLSVGNNRCER